MQKLVFHGNQFKHFKMNMCILSLKMAASHFVNNRGFVICNSADTIFTEIMYMDI